MHRLPLILSSPSYTWDRSLPDYVLFEMALNPENINDMVGWLQQIDEEVGELKGSRRVFSINDYSKALKMIFQHDENSAMEKLNEIILHAPGDGQALYLALKTRANLNYKLNRFENATHDFEFLLILRDNPTEYTSEIYGKLVICFYMQGKYDEAKESYQMFKIHMAKLNKRSPMGGRLRAKIAELELLTSTVDKLYTEIEDQYSAPNPIISEGEQRCIFISEISEGKDGLPQYRLQSKTSLPSNLLVLSEKPIFRTICMPYVQCEHCLKISENMYSCLKCRLKTYCSFNCLQSDTLHVEECRGFKFLTVLMLNSQQLYRAFIETIDQLKHHILPNKTFLPLKKAADILSAIRKKCKKSTIPQLKLLGEEYSFLDLPVSQFSILLRKAVRLTIFIASKTNIVEDLKMFLHTTENHEMAIVGSILMQLEFHLQRGSYIFRFDLASKNIIDKTVRANEEAHDFGINILPKKNALHADQYFCFNQDIISIKVNSCMQVDIDQTTKKAPPKDEEDLNILLKEAHVIPVEEYCDYIANMVLQGEFVADADGSASNLSQYIAQMDFRKREHFLQNYIKAYNVNLFSFFIKKRFSVQDTPKKQIISLFGWELQKFRHSCDPNVEVFLLPSGVLIGKTVKPLHKGDECFISFANRYFHQSHKTRNHILKHYKVLCECQYCRMPAKNEPYAIHSNIFCVSSCRTEFGPVDGKCPKCGRDYLALLQEYAKMISALKSACFENADEGEVHTNWVVLDKVSRRLFPPYNEYRIVQRLKYAKFIALNNFIAQAHAMTKNIYIDLKQYYPQESILFTFYPMILDVYNILQHYNIDQGLNCAPLLRLTEMNRLGIVLIHAQLTHVRIYEKFDKTCNSILSEYRLFCTWKKRMHLMFIDLPPYRSLIRNEIRPPGLCFQ